MATQETLPQPIVEILERSRQGQELSESEVEQLLGHFQRVPPGFSFSELMRHCPHVRNILKRSLREQFGRDDLYTATLNEETLRDCGRSGQP